VLAFENSLAQALADDGRPEEAEQILRHIVVEANRIMGPEHLNTMVAESMHGKILVQLGRFAEAQTVLESCIARLKSRLGDDHLNTLIARNQLPNALIGQGKIAAAEAECRDLLPRMIKTLGPDHPETLTLSGTCAIISAEHGGDLGSAEQTLRDLVSRMSKAMGAEHPSTLLMINWLGEVLDRQSRWADAEPFLKHAYDGAVRAKLIRAHPEFRTEYVTCLQRLGKTAEAREIAQAAPATGPASNPANGLP
jgi:tetratricopeptide (TPR) repeat protein